jgi:predicted 3-demethylubiquinone-9 3-methyltransferase (glyoxalase superfamily)
MNRHAQSGKSKGTQGRRITPFLWFDDNAEEAATFYVSIFRNSRIGNIAHYGEAGAAASGRPKGSVMTVSFTLDGQEFVALNGGPVFTFSPAISFAVGCETQKEIDELWEKLSEGGEELECGWLKDRYGVAWQIMPAALVEMMSDSDPERSERVMRAMLRMKKLDIAGLEKAYGQSRSDTGVPRKKSA